MQNLRRLVQFRDVKVHIKLDSTEFGLAVAVELLRMLLEKVKGWREMGIDSIIFGSASLQFC